MSRTSTKILVVGSGGREHAVCWALLHHDASYRQDIDLYCAPGNAGISEIAQCISINPTNTKELMKFAAEKGIDLTIVGGETALAAGLVDEFEAAGLRIVGPRLAAARLEASKIFAKTFMAKHHIPTARWRAARDASEALGILRSGEFGGANQPTVVKVDGLAAGKGVVVAQDRREAERAIRELCSSDPTQPLVIEEALEGREASLLLFADGNSYALMPAARDHKRLGDQDTGPNTGGMGAITSPEVLSAEELQSIVQIIVEPSINGAVADGFPFRGVLFIGLMITSEGPQVLEYNVRFGDPEAQAILVRLKSDLVEICNLVADGQLKTKKIDWLDGASACVILAAPGYPANTRTGDRIQGLEAAKRHAGVEVFHAGTAKSADGNWITAGGRVLGIASKGSTLNEALERCYASAPDFHWSGIHYRRDIGGFNKESKA